MDPAAIKHGQHYEICKVLKYMKTYLVPVATFKISYLIDGSLN